jgi:hypothetical protein
MQELIREFCVIHCVITAAPVPVLFGVARCHWGALEMQAIGVKPP